MELSNISNESFKNIINYTQNENIIGEKGYCFSDNDLNNWNFYNDGDIDNPIDGTGGTSTGLTLTTTSIAGEILKGEKSFKLTKGAANYRGEGISQDFTLDNNHHEYFEITLDYQYKDGATLGFNFFVYDITNSTLLINDSITKNGYSNKVNKKIYINIPQTCLSFRIGLHVYTELSIESVIIFDSIKFRKIDFFVNNNGSVFKQPTPFNISSTSDHDFLNSQNTMIYTGNNYSVTQQTDNSIIITHEDSRIYGNNVTLLGNNAYCAGRDTIIGHENIIYNSQENNTSTIVGYNNYNVYLTKSCILGSNNTGIYNANCCIIGYNNDVTYGLYSITIGYNNTHGVFGTYNENICIGTGNTIEGGDYDNPNIVLGNNFNITGPATKNIFIGSSASDSYLTDTIIIGNECNANGEDQCIIIGNNSFVSNSSDCIAIGDSCGASQKSTCLGSRGYSSINSIAVGYDTSSSIYSVSIGNSSYAYIYSVAIGNNSSCSDNYGVAIGSSAKSDFSYAIAIGNNAQSNSNYSIAIGSNRTARIPRCLSTQASILPKDNGESEEFLYFSSFENIIASQEIDLTTAPITSSSMNVPIGTTFYLDEVGIILSSLTGTVTSQPDVSVGITAINGKIYLDNVTTTGLINLRDRYKTSTFNSSDIIHGGYTVSLSVESAIGGPSAASGRFYIKGILIENE